MEMVQTRLVVALSVLLLAACTPRYSFKPISVDGRITGAKTVNPEDLPGTVGAFENGVYVSPSGKTFDSGSILGVAEAMLDVQDELAGVKRIIGVSARELGRYMPECELGNMAADCIKNTTEKVTGRKVDLAITNLRGIRLDMPEGNVLLEDILSMFPFDNRLVYVSISGEDLLKVFERMARRKFEPMSGVKIVATDEQLDSVLIGGEPLDPARNYGLATIDFLLDGGDGLSLARSSDMVFTDVKIIDAILPFVEGFAARGEKIDYHLDGRVIVNRTENADEE